MIIGTAGHIDRGKTTLVKALTGIDCDRLKEENARGITLVIAADDGPMPQTREHLKIIELLGIRRGAVALTKSDLATVDRKNRAKIEIAELLTGTALASTPVFPVVATTGEDLAERNAYLRAAAAEAGSGNSAVFRVDRRTRTGARHVRRRARPAAPADYADPVTSALARCAAGRRPHRQHACLAAPARTSRATGGNRSRPVADAQAAARRRAVQPAARARHRHGNRYRQGDGGRPGPPRHRATKSAAGARRRSTSSNSSTASAKLVACGTPISCAAACPRSSDKPIMEEIVPR